jgi:alpha-D-ribose 1-methylphosphonate 5-triphosphate diphosphatase
MDASDMIISGGQVLLPDRGLTRCDLRIQDGRIVALGDHIETGGPRIDAGGRLVLPGMIDFHGDAFERQIMPRPGVFFPLDIALAESDRQVAANGITTAFHGLTISWEPGLRSAARSRDLFEAITALGDQFAVDHKIQIRWETFALDHVDLVKQLIALRPDSLLAFNDHTTKTARSLRDPNKIAEWARRSGVSETDYAARVKRVFRRADEVEQAIGELAGFAADIGVRMASHDDESSDMRRSYRGHGAFICEFPLTEDAAQEAGQHGEPVVLGAPNIVRGGSHTGALDARQSVARGRCNILSSDYYYPAMLAAVEKLVRSGDADLQTAWPLVSSNVAEACGLADRGRIEPGLRADIVVVEPRETGPWAVAATLCAGRVGYRSHL